MAHLTVIAEVLDSLRRHSVNSIRTDQFLGIQYIPIGRVFRAGAGPQRSLLIRPLLFENLKAPILEQPFELLIDQASIGDGYLALENPEFLLLGAGNDGFHFVLEQLIYQHIHTTDKETGYLVATLDALVFAS